MLNLEPCDIVTDLLELTPEEKTLWRGGEIQGHEPDTDQSLTQLVDKEI